MKIIKLHLACETELLGGFDNLDPMIDGWTFQQGLKNYGDGTVDAITISHGLYQLTSQEWPAAIAEFYRVLRPRGILRITEDDCESDRSIRKKNPFPGSKSWPGPLMAQNELLRAGFRVFHQTAFSTMYSDSSLCIHHRMAVPSYVFYIEGVKP